MSKENKDQLVVRLQSASLDEVNGEIVAHGWLDMEAIANLRTGDYQREIMDSRGKPSSLRKAVEANVRLPDIMLGMRGERYTERGSDMYLESDVFIIDGLQRVSALRKLAADQPDAVPGIRIGAEVRFDTTRDSENELFTTLNVQRRAMSPSVILRNLRNHNEAIATLYGLSMHDNKFALLGKVCWDQQMHRGELLTALTFLHVAVSLNRHTAPGGRQAARALVLPRVLEGMSRATGLQHFRNNLVIFYDTIDEIWGVRGLKYKDRATHIKGNFLKQIAGIFSDHEDFWDGQRLVVDAGLRRKLKTFPIDDPTIIRLAGSGNAAGDLLRRHIIDHLNKGKQPSAYLTTRRLDRFYGGRGGKGVSKPKSSKVKEAAE